MLIMKKLKGFRKYTKPRVKSRKIKLSFFRASRSAIDYDLGQLLACEPREFVCGVN